MFRAKILNNSNTTNIKNDDNKNEDETTQLVQRWTTSQWDEKSSFIPSRAKTFCLCKF
jgi:hypothetical protein